MQKTSTTAQKFVLLYIWMLVPLTPILVYLIKPQYTGSISLQYICTAVVLIYLALKRFSTTFKTSLHEIVLIGLPFLIAYMLQNFSDYYAFNVSGDDFSNFAGQIEQNLIGNFGYSPVSDLYHFGVHPNWILVLITPIFALLPHPLFLLTLASILLWTPGILVYFICKNHLKHDNLLSTLAAIIYWTNSYTLDILSGHFYPEMFYPSLFLLIIISRMRNNNWLFWIATMLFMSIKEDFIFYILPWNLYYVIKCKDRKSLLVIIIAIAVYVLDTHLVQPYFLSKSTMAHPGYWGFWHEWGETPSQIFITLLTHPLQVIIHIAKSAGWKSLYSSLGFLPFLSLEYMIFSLPMAILYTLSRYNSALNDFHNYYTYLLWPAALIAFLTILAKVKNLHPKLYPYFVAILIISPLWGSGGLHIDNVNLNNVHNFNKLIQHLDPQQDYCLNTNLIPHINSMHYKIHPLRSLATINCTPVVTANGDVYPYNNAQMNLVIEKLKVNKCLTTYGEFYLVNNVAVCKNLLLNIN